MSCLTYMDVGSKVNLTYMKLGNVGKIDFVLLRTLAGMTLFSSRSIVQNKEKTQAPFLQLKWR